MESASGGIDLDEGGRHIVGGLLMPGSACACCDLVTCIVRRARSCEKRVSRSMLGVARRLLAVSGLGGKRQHFLDLRFV